MKIVSLMDNLASSDGFLSEHGLSLYIEARGKRILFDMGQTDKFLSNAASLGVELSQVDVAVLSHGHYDHGGGLAAFLSLNSKATVYTGLDARMPHYNGRDKYIGLDRSVYESGRIVELSERKELCEGVTFIPSGELRIKHPVSSCGLFELSGGEFIPDDFRHESYLLIEEEGRRVLFSGCSHRGILNIAEHFKPDVLFGGFHFSKRECDRDLARDARELDKLCAAYYTCHCTGGAQYEFMKKHLSSLHYFAAGDIVEL